MTLDLTDAGHRELLDLILIAGLATLRVGVERGSITNLPAARAALDYGQTLRATLKEERK